MSAAVTSTWVVPTARELTDAHWIAHNVAAERGRACLHGEVCTVLDQVVAGSLDRVAAGEMLLGDDTGTIAWLIGFVSMPPFELPRRNPDGTVVTVEQVTAELLVGKTGMPEQRIAAEHEAHRLVARWRRLASLVPH